MKKITLCIACLISISFNQEILSGYLKSPEVSFCMDECGNFLIESEFDTSFESVNVIFDESIDVGPYLDRFVDVMISDRIDCVECNAFLVLEINLSLDCELPVSCTVDPCELVDLCEADFAIDCISNYCGGCFGDLYDNNENLFFCESLEDLSCSDITDIEDCLAEDCEWSDNEGCFRPDSDGDFLCLEDCLGLQELDYNQNSDEACDWIVSNFGPFNYFNSCAEDCDESTLNEINSLSNDCLECLQNDSLSCENVFNDNNERCTDLSDTFFGFCEMFLGYAVSGDSCQPFSGCGTIDEESGLDYSSFFYNSMEDCEIECFENTNNPTAYISLNDVLVSSGQEFNVPIFLESNVDVSGIQFSISQDSTSDDSMIFPAGLEIQNECFSSNFNSLNGEFIGIIFSIEGCSYAANQNHYLGYLIYEYSDNFNLQSQFNLFFNTTLVSDNQGIEIPSTGNGCSIEFGTVGDVNFDTELNVLDIVLIVNYAIFFEIPSDTQFWAADINNDGFINVLDIVQIVNLILEN